MWGTAGTYLIAVTPCRRCCSDIPDEGEIDCWGTVWKEVCSNSIHPACFGLSGLLLRHFPVVLGYAH